MASNSHGFSYACLRRVSRCSTAALVASRDELTSDRFAWNPLLVRLQREAAASARWPKRVSGLCLLRKRSSFLQAAQDRPDFVMRHEEILVGNVL